MGKEDKVRRGIVVDEEENETFHVFWGLNKASRGMHFNKSIVGVSPRFKNAPLYFLPAV